MSTSDVMFDPNVAYEELLTGAARSHRLMSTHIELTHRCNERCAHCYLDVKAPGAKRQAGEPEELSLEEWKRVIDELAAAGCLNLSLSGGEVFVYHDWFELSTYARSKRILLRFLTNGTLITPRVADQLAALHPYMVELSVYGATAQSHEYITHMRGSFQLTMRAFELLRERGIRTMLKTPLMHHNVHEFQELKALAKDLGAQFQHNNTITPSVNPNLNPAQFRMTDDDLRWLLPQIENVQFWEAREQFPDETTCGIGLDAIMIDPYGTVFPCVETRTPVGNLRTSSLKSIWSQGGIWKQFEHLTWGELADCSVCDARKYCLRCHGIALQMEGDMRVCTPELYREASIRKEVVLKMLHSDTTVVNYAVSDTPELAAAVLGL